MTGPIRWGPAYRTTLTNERLGGIRSALAKAEASAMDGLEVRKPSDAPALLPAIHRIQGAVEDQSAYKQNSDRTLSYLDVADQVLGDVSDVLKFAIERVVQFSSETHSPEERVLGAIEIQSVWDTVLSLSNTRVGDRYVFAGAEWDAPAFDPTGTYQGDSLTVKARVSASTDIDLTQDGGAVFQGSVDVFQVLKDAVTALSANDVAATRATLPVVRDALDAIIRSRADIGFRQRSALDAASVAERLHDEFAGQLADLTEVPMDQAISNLVNLRGNYDAALQITAKSGISTLFDLL